MFKYSFKLIKSYIQFIAIATMMNACGLFTDPDQDLEFNPDKWNTGAFDIMFTVSPDIGTDETVFTLTAEVSGDTISDYLVRWDLDNDGIFDTPYLDSLHYRMTLSVTTDSLHCQMINDKEYSEDATRPVYFGVLKNLTDGLVSSGHENVDVCPSGNKLVFNWRYPGTIHEIYEYDMDTEECVNISHGVGHFPDYSFDGVLIAYEGDSGLYIYDHRDDSIRVTLPSSLFNDYWVRWSPVSYKFLTTIQGNLSRFDYESGKYEKITEGDYTVYCWSPDGSKIALGDRYTGVIQIMDLSSKNIIKTFSSLSVGDKFDWSPDGQWLCIGVKNAPVIQVLNYDSGNVYTIIPGTVLNPWYPSWSSDGSSLIFEGLGEDTHHYIWEMEFPL